MAIGVLALQGSFNEHISALRRVGVTGVEIRKPDQLMDISALIIPGGESTTVAKLAQHHNMFPALREFIKIGKPVWGTCAGLILLSNRVIGQKEGGQEIIGGLDCTVHRNFFGSQICSFETEIHVPELSEIEGGPAVFRGIFIRAPAIVEAGPSVEILAEHSVPPFSVSTSDVGILVKKNKVVVAVKQRNLLGTAFHPELTIDDRWYFVRMVKEAAAKVDCLTNGKATCPRLASNPVYELPIFL